MQKNELERLRTDLEDALKARDEFLSIASHELKTPLTSLKLQTQHFKRAVERGDPETYSSSNINGMVTQIEKQISRLNRLVDDMLDVTHIQIGNLVLRPETFQVSDLIADLQETLKDQFASSSYPEAVFINNCGNILVNWDKVRIEQVLFNLFNNAIYNGEGKPIILTTSFGEEKIFITLKDHGVGIAEENMDKIFFRFEKVRNSSEDNGLGLGLYISKQIIDAHKGNISVESKLGSGSLFKIELPR